MAKQVIICKEKVKGMVYRLVLGALFLLFNVQEYEGLKAITWKL